MPFHLPDLNALEKMGDREIRFYAAVGILMSLNGALERLEFTTFRKGARLGEDLAAAVFYQVKNDSARRDMSRVAMDDRMAADPVNKPNWDALVARLNDTNAKRARNLVSHNPAERQVTVHNTGLLMALWNHEIEGVVKQDPIQVKVGKEKDDAADFGRLKGACQHLHPLLIDLEAFLDSLP